MPTTTVHTHTATPVGHSLVGPRQPSESNQPIAAPVRNGHAVSATPDTLRPSAWLRLPIVQNTSTQTTSVAKAASSGRVCCRLAVAIRHHVEFQWHDVFFVARHEARCKG